MNKLISILKKKSYNIRKTMLEMCIKAETGHVTSSLSCIDILVTLYYGNILNHAPRNPSCAKRDRFILSKGQASPALYTILADAGYYKKSALDKFAQKGGMFGVHLQNDVPGVEITSGSLGLGLGIAAGIALGAKMDRDLYLIFTLLGDGECYEGSVWEAAMFASHNRLNNLIAIVDRNYLCVTDFTENLIALEPMEDKWRAFGWDTLRVDGHSFESLLPAFSNLRSRRSSRPLVVIADTTKGEGVECVSNIPLWHGLSPKGEEAELARECLKRRYAHE
ncbi:MAG: transketolase [Candidatus Brocadiaceae bacterium]|nr:transketolase [Candidatus Brocadiaceae bacterium]